MQFGAGKFSVSQTAETDWNDKAFEGLVLDEEVKTFVRDLVAEHKSADNKSFDDIVRDKGRGLVGLLAGSPGVGKVSPPATTSLSQIWQWIVDLTKMRPRPSRLKRLQRLVAVLYI